MKEDPSDFLRRCCIICLEDAVLHPAFPLLVWLMAANAKGYVVGKSQVAACLALVRQLASCPIRDHHVRAAQTQDVSSTPLFVPGMFSPAT